MRFYFYETSEPENKNIEEVQFKNEKSLIARARRNSDQQKYFF